MPKSPFEVLYCVYCSKSLDWFKSREESVWCTFESTFSEVCDLTDSGHHEVTPGDIVIRGDM